MSIYSLMYHDVINENGSNLSGFQDQSAENYKITINDFKKHLTDIKKDVSYKSAVISDLLHDYDDEHVFLLTFDDGGLSFYTYIADLLEEFEMKGHFFITTNYINSPSFIKTNQIRSLYQRGHIIGTHSSSHPSRFSSCSWSQLITEWSESTNILSEIIGNVVDVASVPGGYYSRKVAEAAAAVGIKVLFTSEPTISIQNINGCMVIGRYAIKRYTSSKTVVGIANGKILPRLKQKVAWELKKAVKTITGENYLKLRKFLIERK